MTIRPHLREPTTPAPPATAGREAGEVRAAYEATTRNLLAASSGRVHSAQLGDKDCYEADRTVVEALRARCPAVTVAARASRAFLLRAVHHLATQEGVGQFLELGSGYPTYPNVHDVVGTGGKPLGPRVMYVDSDPVVATHGRARLCGKETRFAQLDIADTGALVHEMYEMLDLRAPVAVSLVATAEHLADPVAVIDAVTDVLAPGSYLVLCHTGTDLEPEQVAAAVEIYADADIAFTARDKSAIEAMLTRYEVLEPGLTTPHRWFPHESASGTPFPGPNNALPACSYAAVGYLR